MNLPKNMTIMKRITRLSALLMGIMCCCQLTAQDNSEYAANYAKAPRFRALVHYEPRAAEISTSQEATN